VSGEGAEGITAAVFEFMEEIRPRGGVFGAAPLGDGPPYTHRLGPTHSPAFTLRRLLAPWEPPLSQFGTPVLSFRPFPVGNKEQEIPKAFRRR
jgi:hypothetical protein